MIRLEHLSKTLRGRRALDDVTLDATPFCSVLLAVAVVFPEIDPTPTK
jgi:hypothetical protein